MTRRLISLALASALAAACALPARADWFPYQAESISPPFSADGKRTAFNYQPLAKAAKPWELCVSFPHMKDAYWLGVDYGVVEESRRQGVKMHLFEAGGYTNLNRQISQIEDCVARGAQAVIIGAISADGLNSLVKSLAAKKIPVIDVINGINSSDLTAKSLVSFYTMGQSAAEYLVKRHPDGSPKVKVGWFPGPAGAGWVEAAHQGFMDAIKGHTSIEVLDPQYGDTGKEAQSKLVEDALQAHPDLAYVAGTAVTAEASVGLVRSRHLQDKVKLLSFYMTPGVYDGIRKGRILAAPADSMVIQGRIAVDQAVRALEGRLDEVDRHVGPKIFVVDNANVQSVKLEDILPPANFKPVFEVK